MERRKAAAKEKALAEAAAAREKEAKAREKEAKRREKVAKKAAVAGRWSEPRRRGKRGGWSGEPIKEA